MFGEETVKEAIKDGVKVLEASIDCHELMRFTEKDEFFKTILYIRNKYIKYIDFRPELGMPKNISNENLDKLLLPCIDSGVFNSMDLYGDETIDDFERFRDYYKYAKKKGIKLKVHAGEFHDFKNVKKAIEILEVDEIQLLSAEYNRVINVVYKLLSLVEEKRILT